MEDVFLDKLFPTDSGLEVFAIVKPRSWSNDLGAADLEALEEKVHSYLEVSAG